ncbi:hypothetical protein EB796_016415 [Bugula neritina]|uniref:Uncharacterized protein n=1 Tax=Bugula neritina TaxID=10212 RepID=A0A7J7JGR5_BUGNE|nr:hypothetical protein EB796_016415 [Bugula neritina]
MRHLRAPLSYWLDEPLPPGVEPAQISASLETVAQSISSTSNKSLESLPSSTNLTVALPSAALPVASAVQSAAPEPLDVQSPAAKPVTDLSAASLHSPSQQQKDIANL